MNWDKFKNLSLRGKLQWLLQYYGLTAAIAATAIIVGAVFLTSVFGPGENYALRVMILDDRSSADLCRVFGEELGEVLGGACDVTAYLKSDPDQMQAFVVRLMADNLDIVIAPADETQQLLQSNFLSGAMGLEADSFYYACTGGGPDQEGGALYLGTAASGRNAGNVPAGMAYFTGGK